MKKRLLRYSSLLLAMSMLIILVMPAQARHGATPFDILYADLKLDDETGGLAEGMLTIVMRNGIPESRVIAFWADETGPLREYDALAPITVQEGINRIEMKSGTVIPESAQRLMLFQEGRDGLSYENVEVALPENAVGATEQEPLYEFQVISDTHIRADWAGDNNYNFQRALTDISWVSPESKGIIVNGDMTNRGLPVEYEILMQTAEQVPGLPNLYMGIGNHEYFSVDSYQEAERLFLQTAALPDGTHPERAYYDFYLGSAHFVFLAPDCSSGLGDGVVWCGEEQLAWLEETLSRDGSDVQRFVFLHEAIENTVSGSFPEQEWGSYQDDGVLQEILEASDNTVLFTSHTHWTLNDPDTLFQYGELSILNTAAVAYLSSSEREAAGENIPGSQGYYVRVYDSYIEVFGRDFITGRYLPSAMFRLPLGK